MGVPTVCSMSAEGSGAHTMEEKASVESFFQRWIIALASIMEIDQYAGNQ